MSGMAKIFVVVNRILVTAVWGSAATLLGAQDDYRKAMNDAKDMADKMESQLQAELKTVNDQVATQRIAAAEQRSRAEDAEQRLQIFEQKANQMSQINAQLTATNSQLSDNIAGLKRQLEGQQQTVSAAQQEAQDANQKFRDAHKQLEEESRNRAALEARVSELDDTNRALQATVQEQAKQIRDKDFWIEEAKKRLPDLGAPEQGEDGRILEVENVAGGGIIVVISVGRDDGVRVGDTYKFRRGNKFVGSGRVTRVLKDKSVVDFDTQFTGSGAPPQANDEAYVR